MFGNPRDRESLELPVRSPLRYLRIRIENGDSPPLELSGALGYAVPTYLVFEPANQSRFILYAGNPDTSASHYESAKVLASLDTRTLPKRRAADLEEQPSAQTKELPAGERLVWVVLAVVAAFTVWILWYTARTLGRDQDAAASNGQHHS